MKGFRRSPDCSNEKKDCAACVNGRCIALENTDFGDKMCPFYMDIKTKNQRIADSYSRLLEKGFIIKRTG